MSKTAEFLKATLLADVIEGVARTSYVVPQTMLVADFLKEMGERGFQAAPVYSGDADEPSVVAVLSVMEVMTVISFAAFYLDREKPDALANYTSMNIPPQLTVGDVVKARVSSEVTNLWAYEPTVPLADVVDVMARGVHRVVTFVGSDPASRRRQPLMLTQTDVLRFLQHHMDKLDGALMHTHIDELNLVHRAGSDKMVLAYAGDSALGTFATMAREQVYATPVVEDGTGALITTLSSSDLRAVHHSYGELVKPVRQFLLHVHGGQLVHPVTCDVRATLEALVPMLIAARIHRVWVVDSAQKVLGVVSISDILRTLSSH